MRIRIGRTIFISVFLLLCAAALASVSGPALARSPKPGIVSIFDDFVAAEPGEDPHLKVDPEIRVEPVERLGAGAPPAAGGDDRDLLGDGESCPAGRGTRSSRVYHKFIAALRIFFAATMPR